MTTIGELNKRFSLQTSTRVSDGAGGFTTSWATIATVWGKKTTHRSDEAVQAMKETGTATHNIRIRYRTDVKSSWRVKDGNKYMTIIGPPVEVNEGMGKRWLDLTVREAA